MKNCSRCGLDKSVTGFGRNAAREDGLQAYCRDCMRKYSEEHRKKKPVGWIRKTADIVSYRKEYRKNNTDRLNRLKQEWLDRNPDRNRAKEAVRYAVRTGRLVKLPCWCCGALKVEAHHVHYDLPLDVVWLCREHHRQVHKEFRPSTHVSVDMSD